MSETRDRVHLITAEYPPRVGGVSDHSFQIAAGLAGAGDEVHVWCRSIPERDRAASPPGVTVHDVGGSFAPADLRRIGGRLDAFPTPRRLLVQWVPHGYGYRSLNLFFCLWLLSRSRSGDRVELIVHEPWLPFSRRRPLWIAPALVHRLMTLVLLRAASKVWVSAPEWAELWKGYDFAGRTPFEWLPLPNGIPVVRDEVAVAAVRDSIARPGDVVIGYFGLAGAAGELLSRWSRPLLADSERGVRLLLTGQGSEEYRAELVRADPAAADRIHASGVLSRRQVSLHLQACDLLIQPYPGGANARRSSLVAALGHGLPVVTTKGRFTEPFWEDSGGVELVGDEDAAGAARVVEALIADDERRRELSARAAALYDARFDLRHAIGALRSAPPSGPITTGGLS